MTEMDLLARGCSLLRAQAQRLLQHPVADTLSFDSVAILARVLGDVREHVLNDAAEHAYLIDPSSQAAYAVGLAPRTLAAVLHELPRVDGSMRVLDLGAGTGAASLACALKGARRFVLVDHAPSALENARTLLMDAGAEKVDVVVGNLAKPDTVSMPLSEIVIFAFSLLEAAGDDEARAQKLLRMALSRVAPGGVLLLVDSAQKSRARMVNALRSVVMEAGHSIHAPCPHEAACPALLRDRDFCHAAMPWGLPDDFVNVGERAGLHRHRLTYSFLLVGKTPVATHPPRLRVIGEVLKEKGRSRVAVCTHTEVRELMVLSRHKAAVHALQALERGAELPLLAPANAGQSWRIDDEKLLELP